MGKLIFLVRNARSKNPQRIFRMRKVWKVKLAQYFPFVDCLTRKILRFLFCLPSSWIQLYSVKNLTSTMGLRHVLDFDATDGKIYAPHDVNTYLLSLKRKTKKKLQEKYLERRHIKFTSNIIATIWCAITDNRLRLDQFIWLP